MLFNWPLPVYISTGKDGVTYRRFPVVSNPFTGKGKHEVADIMYPRIAIDVDEKGYTSKSYIMFRNIPVFAIADGIVTSAGKTTKYGYQVTVDHGDNWAAHYTHMQLNFVKTGDKVKLGQRLGIVGASPSDNKRLKHLHIQIRHNGDLQNPKKVFKNVGGKTKPTKLEIKIAIAKLAKAKRLAKTKLPVPVKVKSTPRSLLAPLGLLLGLVFMLKRKK